MSTGLSTPDSHIDNFQGRYGDTITDRVAGARVRHCSSGTTRSLLALALGASLCVATLSSGCAASREGMAQLMTEVRALNKALLARLQGLEKTGLQVVENGDRISIVVPDVFFDFGSARLSEDARSAISQAANLLRDKKYEAYQITIEGHTDSKGSAKFNSRLSRDRADAVEKELLFSSVRDERILAVLGLGETQPVASNVNSDGTDNPEGRARNRRVEIVLTDPRLGAN